jgi:RimJ/RimL family protein N-acetyltransferase
MSMTTPTPPRLPLRTSRLILREWRPEDLDAYAALNADPEVMRYFPQTYSREESAEQMARMAQHQAVNGFTFWAAELPGEAPFIGFIGLARPTFQAHFVPCVEIGWRLARPYWGRGLATEGAKAALSFGFNTVGAEEIVALTTVSNQRSRAVMVRLGMGFSPDDDFDHPRVPEGSPLRRHVLYRLKRPL